MAFWCQVWLDRTSPSLLLERPESEDINNRVNRVNRVHEWILNESRPLKFETKETPCLALCECQTDDDSDRDSDSDGEISNVNNLDYEAPQECPRHAQSDSESQKTHGAVCLKWFKCPSISLKSLQPFRACRTKIPVIPKSCFLRSCRLFRRRSP